MKYLQQYWKTILSIVVVISLLTMFPLNFNNKVTASKVKSDTIYISKKIIIPEVKGKFEEVNPKPKDGVVVYDKELLKKYNELKTENEKLTSFKSAIQVRQYENSYTDKDSLVTITVKDSITGTLKNQKVDFKIKERQVEYKEKTVTNTVTEKIKPSFIIATGFSAQAGTTLINNKPNVGVTIGLKNKNGYSLDVNYNTENNVMVTFKKDIITFW